MFAQFKTLPQLFDFFKDEETCLAYWEQIRYGNGNPTCPHCGYEGGAYKTDRGYKCKNKECQKKYTSKVGSIFEASKLPLRTWFAAIYLCCNHKKGISSLQLSRDLDIHQKSAWFMLHRIRTAFGEINPEMLGAGGQVVEVDETYVGGKMKNMTHKKRKELVRKQNDNKTMMMGYVERGGHLRLEVDSDKKGILDNVKRNVSHEAVLLSDMNSGYKSAIEHFVAHEQIDHSNKEYVRNGVIHTNTIEGVFSQFDRMVIGTYHYVSPKHMQAYANECAYRYNTRKGNITARFEDVVGKCSGVRVKYEILIGKS